jgi:hypothetical protein
LELLVLDLEPPLLEALELELELPLLEALDARGRADAERERVEAFDALDCERPRLVARRD